MTSSLHDRKVEALTKTKNPSLYNVVLGWTDETTVDDVIRVLTEVFRYNYNQSVELANKMKEDGRVVAGTYTKEISNHMAHLVKEFTEKVKIVMNVTVEEVT